jgi:hypothetical protein
MVTAREQTRTTVDKIGPLGAEIGSGGQGKVFALPRSPALVYKQYSDDVVGRLDVAALAAMVELPATLPADDRKKILARSAWPLTVVERAGAVSGFLMARVPPQYRTKLTLPSREDDRLGQTQLLLNDQQYLDARKLAVSDAFRLELLHDVAETLELFHRLQVTVGDFSPNNLLFSAKIRPRCYFIDCDAMRVRGQSVLPQIETADWQVPAAGEPLATPGSDGYKFALLCVRLFAGDQTTMDPTATRRAGQGLYELAVRGLSQRAGQRPSMTVWRGALATAPPPPRVPPQPVRRPRPAATPAASAAAPSLGRRLGARLRRTRAKTAVKLALAAAFLVYAVPHAADFDDWAGQVIENATTDRGAGQASSVAALLTGSAKYRRQVQAAVTDVIKCRRLKPAAAKLATASSARGSMLVRAGQLKTDRLSGGAELKTELVAAFGHAKAADDAYRRWALALNSKGCRSSARNGTDRKRGDAESAKATTAKKKVATLWNQIAAQYDRQPVSYLNI